MKKASLVFIVCFLVLTLSISTGVHNAYGSALVWTDKPDYSPGDTAIISGSGFLANTLITITITYPNSTVRTIYAGTDGSGAFNCHYPLDGITGTYTVIATDGTDTATTTFTDTMKYFTSIVGPTTTDPGQTQTYTITITNDPTSSEGAKMGSALIIIPSGFTSVSIISWAATGGKSWTASIVAGQIELLAVTPPDTDRLERGEFVWVSFSATAPLTAGTYTWTTTAYTLPDWSSDKFDLVGSQPTVTVGYTVHLESEQDTLVTSNLGTITFDGTAYSLPNDVFKTAGSYGASYSTASGYVFDHWVTTGGVSVSSTSANPTTATVSSLGGTLRAVYTIAPTPTYTVHLESEQDTLVTSNLGTITFDGTAYSLPNDVSKATGSYSAQYYPVSGYVFGHWETASGVSVSSTTANPTTATVSSPGGTLRAVYKTAPPTIYTVHLESVQDTSATSNLGTITLDGTAYPSLPSDVSKAAGGYGASYSTVSGYVFDHWVATGGVSVSSTTTISTTVTVSGDGTLEAVYKTAPRPTALVGGEWTPIMLQTLSSVNTLQLLAPWIGLASTIAIAASFVATRRIKKREARA